MKTELKVKYLQNLLKKKQNKNAGFTLIELLVVVIIIGILAAIALPSFLNQAAKARGAEGKSNVGALNRAQQAHFVEQQTFTTSIPDLGLSMKTTTDNFEYTAAANGAIATGVSNFGTSKQPDIKSYVGGTFYTGAATTVILCENKTADDVAAAAPTAPAAATTGTGATAATCATTTTEVK